MKTLPLIAGLFLAILSAVSAQIVTNLDDQFATDGNITNTVQSLPTSARWYSSQAATNANVSGNVLTFGNITNTSATGALAYFKTAGTYISLINSGDFIKLSFDYSFASNNVADGAFRFGLFSSGGTRSTADANGFNNSVFSNWTGYFGKTTFGTNNASSRSGVQYRTNGGNNLMTGTTQIGSGYNLTNGNSTNTFYSASIQLTLTNSTIVLDTVIAGQAISRTDSVALWTNFDSVVFSASAAAIGSYSIDNVQVTSYSIPEPSTVAMLGLTGVALVAYRLRRRNR